MYQFTMAHGGFALGQEIHFQASMTCEEFENITTPIALQHSKVDTMVPFVAAEETARQLGAELIPEEHGEHANLHNMQKLLSLMVS
jgi:predicted alpha/beta hydrolase family esterase